MHTFIAFGPFDAADARLTAAAAAAGGEVRVARSLAELGLEKLERRPDALLVALDAADLDDLVTATHSHPRLEGVPVLMVVPRLTPSAALRSRALGADDFVAADDLAALLPSKLAASAQAAVAPVRPAETRVLLCDASPLHAGVLARLLGQAGFQVTVAQDGERALAELAPAGPVVLILDLGLPGCDPARFLVDARARRVTAPPAIAMTHAGIGPDVAAAAIANGFRHVHDKRRPPDELVFLANEAATLDRAPMRASPRLLCALLVGFRREGGRWEYGLSHNLSLGGLYVRTIDPPLAGTTLELEFTPPGSDALIAARATVAWCKDFSQRAMRTAPTGMGLRLVDPDDQVQRAMARAASLLAGGQSTPAP